MSDLFGMSFRALKCCGFSQKQSLIKQLGDVVSSASFSLDSSVGIERVIESGRPPLPFLVPPAQVPRRRLGTVAGRIALIHAVAHIEFNAMNFALDAVYRFRDMPRQYYRDWVKVASEEAVHFSLLSDRLHELDSYYGELPAHGGMWAMAVATDYDVMARMALVPRVLEARGLDVTPGMIKKLRAVDDQRTVAIFERILSDEVDHVRIGNHWFQSICDQRGLFSSDVFGELLRKHGRIALRGPFNEEARLSAGFTKSELAELALIEQEFKSQLNAECEEHS